MNNKQLSEHIGNIDDILIQQAEKLPNYAAQHRRKRLKQLLATAAVLLLMVGSFSVGAFAFANEVIVEVPVAQEQVTLEEIGITLILPNSWKGKYGVVEGTFEPNNSPMWEFYVKSIYDSKTPTNPNGESFYRGTLFYVFQYADYSISAKEFASDVEIAGTAHYLFSTESATYAIMYAPDMQFDPENSAQRDEYQTMEQSIQELQFIMPGISEIVADHKSEIIHDIYTIISEAQKPRYKITNYELQITGIEENRANYCFIADWEPCRTVEEDPLMQGLRQAASLLTDEQEKAYAEKYINGWLLEMQGWQETERLETPIVVIMESEDSWTLYYPYVKNDEETLILLSEYIKENWTEDSEARRQSGIDLLNEAIKKFRNKK